MLGSVLQKTLSNILTKMNKDIQLTEGDQIAQFEICLTFFIIINQSKNFRFSEHNLVRQHLINEYNLSNKSKRKSSKTTPDDALLFREGDDPSNWPFKC